MDARCARSEAPDTLEEAVVGCISAEEEGSLVDRGERPAGVSDQSMSSATFSVQTEKSLIGGEFPEGRGEQGSHKAQQSVLMAEVVGNRLVVVAAVLPLQ